MGNEKIINEIKYYELGEKDCFYDGKDI